MKGAQRLAFLWLYEQPEGCCSLRPLIAMKLPSARSSR